MVSEIAALAAGAGKRPGIVESTMCPTGGCTFEILFILRQGHRANGTGVRFGACDKGERLAIAAVATDVFGPHAPVIDAVALERGRQGMFRAGDIRAVNHVVKLFIQGNLQPVAAGSRDMAPAQGWL